MPYPLLMGDVPDLLTGGRDQASHFKASSGMHGRVTGARPMAGWTDAALACARDMGIFSAHCTVGTELNIHVRA